jgi:hypothetical protein
MKAFIVVAFTVGGTSFRCLGVVCNKFIGAYSRGVVRAVMEPIHWLGCGLDVRGFAVRFSARAKDFSLLRIRDRPWVPTNVLFNACICAPFPEAKRPGCEADHFSSIAGFKNKWIYTSTAVCSFVAFTGTSLQWLSSVQCRFEEPALLDMMPVLEKTTVFKRNAGNAVSDCNPVLSARQGLIHLPVSISEWWYYSFCDTCWGG